MSEIKKDKKKCCEKLALLEEQFQLIQYDYKVLFLQKEELSNELKEMKKVYGNLFTSTLRYRTFYRRLKNLFNKF